MSAKWLRGRPSGGRTHVAPHRAKDSCLWILRQWAAKVQAVDSDADKRARYKAERKQLLKAFAANLVPLRGERTQEEIAAKANLHPTSISYLERGEREPSMSTLLILAAAYGVSVDQILEGLPTPAERKPPPQRESRRHAG